MHGLVLNGDNYTVQLSGRSETFTNYTLLMSLHFFSLTFSKICHYFWSCLCDHRLRKQPDAPQIRRYNSYVDEEDLWYEGERHIIFFILFYCHILQSSEPALNDFGMCHVSPEFHKIWTETHLSRGKNVCDEIYEKFMFINDSHIKICQCSHNFVRLMSLKLL